MPELLVGIDVGATGIKAGLFDPRGRLVARASRRNAPRPQVTPLLSGEGQGEGPGEGLIWDGDEIWRQVCVALREVTAGAPAGSALRGVAVTGFGAGGGGHGRRGRGNGAAGRAAGGDGWARLRDRDARLRRGGAVHLR